jgi:cytochrome P450
VAFLAWWYGTKPRNAPPGPMGLPLLGNMLEVSPGTAHFTLEEWAKKYGPIYSFYQASRFVVVLTDYDLIQDALQKQGDVFSGKPSFIKSKGREPKTGVLAAEGARWKEHRRFALSTLRDFGFGRPILEPKIHLETQELLTEIASTKGKPFDPLPLLSTAVSNVICSMIFGHRFDLDSKLKYYLDALNYRLSQSEVNNLSPIGVYPWLKWVAWVLSPKMRKFTGGNEELLEFMQQEIDITRKNFDPKSTQEPECYVHAYDKAALEGQLEYSDNNQLKAMISDLFVAGSDTTQTSLRWALFYMATYPKIQDKVYEEISEKFGNDEIPSFADRTKLPYTEATLLEIQRQATLLPLSLIHRATESTKLAGYDIPEDTWIVNHIWAVHRNPKYFPDPEAFKPERFLDEKQQGLKKPLQLIPFSTGKRVCLGESLAKMEMFIFFAALMQNYKFTFASEEDSKVQPFFGFLRSPGKFLLRAEKRQQ